MNSSFVQRIRSAIDLGAALAMIVIAGVVLWRAFGQPTAAAPTVTVDGTRPADPVPTEPISIDNISIKGDPAAKVVVIEYGDLQCPACIRFANETYQLLMTKFVDTGRARFAFRHFPLPNHPMARPAAIAAQCAGEQGKFWPSIEKAYQGPSKLDETFWQAAAKSLELDRARWSRCRKDGAAAAAVQRDSDEARRLKLRATPAFLIGATGVDGRFRATAALYGARELGDFDTAIVQAEKRGLAAGK